MKFSEGPQCGIFMNAVVKILDKNVMDGYKMDYTEIEGEIMDKVSNTVVPVYGKYDDKIGQKPTATSTITTKIKKQILLGKSSKKGMITWL